MKSSAQVYREKREHALMVREFGFKLALSERPIIRLVGEKLIDNGEARLNQLIVKAWGRGDL